MQASQKPAQSISAFLDKIAQKASGEFGIDDPSAEKAANPLPMGTSRECVPEVVKPAHEGLSRYRKHPGKFTGADALRPALFERSYNQYDAAPVHPAAHKHA